MRSLLVAGISMLATTPAFASSQADINACKSAVMAEAEDRFDMPKVTFKSIRGASLKTVKFEVTSGGQSAMAVCEIKRGKIRAIEW